MKTVFIILIIATACSFKKDQLENQTIKGHEELYSEPAAVKHETDGDVKRIVIAATNDLQGHFSAHKIKFRDQHSKKKHTIKMGGVDIISSYFKILRQNYGDILLVDSGDILPKRIQEISYVQDFYSLMDYDAVTLGLRDFNLRFPSKYPTATDFFQEFSSKLEVPIILSNLYDLKTARVVEWKGTKPYLLRQINGSKVGIIGLIPDDIVGLTPVEGRVGLFVENMLQSTLRHARLLKSLGAEIIVVLTHQGITCGEKLAAKMNLPLSKVNFEPHRDGICDLSSPLGQYLKRLPPNLVDVVFGGRNHHKTVNYVNTTLVMSGFEEGKSFSYVEFFVDAKTKKVIKDKTVAHQPVYFCHEFFKETKDCFYEDETIDHKERIPATFLGQVVTPDKTLEQKFKYYLKASLVSPPDLSLDAIISRLKYFENHIAYLGKGDGFSKLITIQIKGIDLIKILEEDFNRNHRNWFPEPFNLKGEMLSLNISNEAIAPLQTYKILTDLESLQGHPILKKFINSQESKTHPTVSWNSNMETDNVSVKIAAPNSDTVR